eukprot:CAMPEP_0179610728 /NCGR_PEP_ID=MMETSP0930-20121108/3640_1 /TAXON_ID=548131 ORGANISM="Ostreococcus mediterraneus, Strain clade-D-RCC1621" /NCGR_SAMPLE_ID=MMETSP0930 /ASSEMBLY_ACC=CAM_ASM_000580 /LENGTH=239 /DNA_ID=CAMNT_0021479305 /DNA_START=828 /DNA_END=1547 /DNA_ORIENTATION=-
MNIHPSQRTACHSSSSPTSPLGMITADIDAHACDMFTFSDPMCDHACDASARAWKTHKELLAEAKKTIELLTAFESMTASQATTTAANASAMETSAMVGAGAGHGLEMATGTTTGARVDTNPTKKRGRPRGSKTKRTTGIAVERVVRKPPVSIAPHTGVELGFCTSCKRRLPLKDHFQEGRRTCLNCLSWHKLYARRTRRVKCANLKHESAMASKLKNAGDAAASDARDAPASAAPNRD